MLSSAAQTGMLARTTEGTCAGIVCKSQFPRLCRGRCDLRVHDLFAYHVTAAST